MSNNKLEIALQAQELAQIKADADAATKALEFARSRAKSASDTIEKQPLVLEMLNRQVESFSAAAERAEEQLRVLRREYKEANKRLEELKAKE